MAIRVPGEVMLRRIGVAQPTLGNRSEVVGQAHLGEGAVTSDQDGPRAGRFAPRDEWLSTEGAAQEIGGVTARWVRLQIEADRLRARVLLTGRRPTYRVRRRDLDRFLARYVLDDATQRDDG
jgi:hypothetical protein